MTLQTFYVKKLARTERYHFFCQNGILKLLTKKSGILSAKAEHIVLKTTPNNKNYKKISKTIPLKIPCKKKQD